MKMTEKEIREYIAEDIDNIMNVDFSGMKHEESKKWWQKHLRHMDKLDISPTKEAEIRKEIIKERGKEFEDSFNIKLNSIIKAITTL